MICTFFGHSDAPYSLAPILEARIAALLEECPDAVFYMGNNGNFDRMALNALKKLSPAYPEMSFAVALAYLPIKNTPRQAGDGVPTVFPEGIESAPKRYAISYRNRWLVRTCDTVICYVVRRPSRAAEFVRYAENCGKNIIALDS